MIEIILAFLTAPLLFADYSPPFFYTAIPKEQRQDNTPQIRQNYTEDYKENEKNNPQAGGDTMNVRVAHGSYNYFSPKKSTLTHKRNKFISPTNQDGFVRVLPLELVRSESVPLPMITEGDITPLFQDKNKQMAASISDFFKLESGNVVFRQNIQTGYFLEYFRMMTSGLVATGQAHDSLPDKKDEEPKQKFVQVIKGCALVVSDDCLIVRSGAGNEFEKLYKLRVDTFLEVDEVVENDNSEVWYKIKHEDDIPHPDRIKGTWFVPDTHVKVVEISGEPVFDPDKSKKIVIDISEQILRAYENDELVIKADVSTGLSGRHSTPVGEFQILKKLPSRYMQAPSSGIQDWYDLPGVPYVIYFTDSGDAIHGVYWHDKFGRRWSHGCVNASFETAKLLYEWAPVDTKVVIER